MKHEQNQEDEAAGKAERCLTSKQAKEAEWSEEQNHDGNESEERTVVGNLLRNLCNVEEELDDVKKTKDQV